MYILSPKFELIAFQLKNYRIKPRNIIELNLEIEF